MWSPFVIIVAIAAHARAGFSPAFLVWEGAHDRRFVLVPESTPHNALAFRKPSVQPGKLVLLDETTGSQSDIPRFTANLDKTISSADGLCLEAGDDANEHVRINLCTGRPNQLWSFVPSGDGGLNQIRLEAVNKCIGIDVHDGGLNGAPVHLRECSNQMTEVWKLEEPTPIWTQRHTLPSATSLMRQVMICAMALGGLGAVSASAWLWQWQRTAHSEAVQDDASLITIQGGIPLTTQLAACQGRTVPAAMKSRRQMQFLESPGIREDDEDEEDEEDDVSLERIREDDEDEEDEEDDVSLEQESENGGQPSQGEQLETRTDSRVVPQTGGAQLWKRRRKNWATIEDSELKLFEGPWSSLDDEEDDEDDDEDEEDDEEDVTPAMFFRRLRKGLRRLPDVTPSSILTGTVECCEPDGFMLEIGHKSLAWLPVDHVGIRPDTRPEELPSVGDRIEVQIMQDPESKLSLTVSARKIKFEEAWDKVIELEEAGTAFETEVVGVNTGGLIVHLDGLLAFLPRSHLSTSVIPEGGDVSALVGSSFPCKFLSVDYDARKMIVSNSLAVVEKVNQTMQVGKLVVGRVKAVTSYGAFVDIQGSDGLLHRSQISTSRFVNVEDVLPVGSVIKAVVMEYEKQTGKISLSTKVLEPFPGDMINNPDQVYVLAEMTAAMYNQKQAEAEKKAGYDLVEYDLVEDPFDD